MDSNSPITGGFSMFRDPSGGDPSSPFEDDPSLSESYPADSASGLGDVVEDDEVEEEDVEDDGLEDDDEFEDDDDFEDEDDDEEAALAPALHAQDDSEADDDSGDDGRENAVDEDKLNSEEEDDFSDDASSLTSDEVRAMRKGLAMLPTTLSYSEICAIL